jgi:predicted phosphodiesterase
MPRLGARTLSRRDALKGLAGAAVGAATGAVAFGYAFERHRIEVTRASLDISGLPAALVGYRIGMVTDTHRSQTVPPEDIDRAVRLVLEERPDLIVLGGDYVTWGDRRYIGSSAETLAPLTAPDGVFAILGNHDDDRDMPAALTARGFTVLKDVRTRVTLRGEAIDLVGIRYWTRKLRDLAHLVEGASAPVFLLAHNPRRLIEAAALDVPLVLSGHTQGTGGAARSRGDRRARLSSRVGRRTPREHGDLREPGCGNGVPAGSAELPPGSGHHHAAASVGHLRLHACHSSPAPWRCRPRPAVESVVAADSRAPRE